MSRQQERRFVRPGELLAIRQDFVQSQPDRGAFFWLFGPAVRRNERIGDLAVIRINGPMEHHDDGCGESYELIIDRARKAFSGQDVVEEETRKHRWWDDEPGETWEPPEASPPKCVALRIDSPGGVVAGLNECVRTLRRLSKETRIPLIAFTDEMAASAAYALCCACERVYVTKSSVVGSVGVISTMVDQVGFDKKAGFRFVVLTSGKRKADGHVHVPISKEAIEAEEPRVATLAAQFWAMVKRARGIPVAQIQGYEAAIFLGEEAVEAELADEVATWDDIVAQYAGTNELAQNGTTVHPSGQSEEVDMALTAEQSLRNAIAKEKDPARLTALKMALDAYKKETHQIEKHTKEEGEEDEDEEEGEEDEKGNETRRTDDEDENEDEEGTDEKKKSTAAPEKKSAKAKTKSRKSEEEEEEAASEEDDAEALAAQVRRATGKSGTAAQGALDALLRKAQQSDVLAGRVAALERDRSDRERNAVVDGALAQRRISKREANTLRQKPMAYVSAFIDARPKAIFNEDGDQSFPILRQTGANGEDILPPDLQKQLDAAVLASEGKVTREQILETHNKRGASRNGAQNGAP